MINRYKVFITIITFSTIPFVMANADNHKFTLDRSLNPVVALEIKKTGIKTLTPDEKKSYDLYQLEEKFYKCREIIGREEWEASFSGGVWRNFLQVDDIFHVAPYRKKPNRITLKPMSLLIFKCTNYLYLHMTDEDEIYTYLSSKEDVLDQQYLMNFSYHQYSAKAQEVESLYESLYLEALNSQKDMPHLLYPKSLVRKHANRTGLTIFIQDKESIAKKTLSHKQLAIEFFGSQEKWLEDLNNYIHSLIKG